MKNEYGVQLYSVRDVSSVNLDSALKVAANAGYKYVEFAGFFSHTADEVKLMLDKYGLKPAGAHIGWTSFAPENLDELIEYHSAIGNKNVVIPAFDCKEETLEKLISYVNQAEPKLKENGLSAAFHNHSVEFQRTDYGKVIFDEIVSRTNLDLQLDVFWVYNAGLDPVEMIEKYKSRIKSIHLKDGLAYTETESGKPEGRYIGKGSVPIKEVIDIASRYGILMIVESEDLNPDGETEIMRCMEYLVREG